ncbi:MAG TPA: dihydrolipoamide acyltransferase [Acholeplasmataceae bacterium]|nr:dihydrolipoamide acyltransferase [Acholeplasmataceae bacterium]
MFDFKFSDVGEGLHEGVILEWHFKEGDTVKEGELLVVIETDKVNAELTAPVSGVIKKLGAQVGQMIHVGETLVLIDDGTGGDVPEGSAPAEEVKTEAAGEGEENEQGVIGEIEVSSAVMASSNEGMSAAPTQTQTATKALATPAARKLARDLGVDINTVTGSGAHGRVMKEDIIAASGSASTQTVAAPKVSISKEGNVEVVPITKLRKAIVSAMTRSKQIIPHTVLINELEVDQLVELRQSLKNQELYADVKITYMPFIMKAVVKALQAFPVFNSSFDQENDQVVLKKFYNLGMAVDTPDGLIVPVVKNADDLTIVGLAKETRRLAELTRDRKVQLADLKDATFSITNFGSIGVPFGTPIINHPEVAILGVGNISRKPVVRGDQVVPGYVMPLSLAVDHRIIDGADAGRFLNLVKQLLENPSLLLID